MVAFFISATYKEWWSTVRHNISAQSNDEYFKLNPFSVKQFDDFINRNIKPYGARYVRTNFHANGKKLCLEKLEFNSEEQLTLFLLKFAG